LTVASFDGSVHPLNLAVGPRVVRLCEPVLDIVRLADHVEAHLTRPDGVAIARLLGKLDAPFDFAQDRIIGEDRVDPVGYGFQQVFQELPRCPSISLVDELGDCELAGVVNADEQVELAFGSLRIGVAHP